MNSLRPIGEEGVSALGDDSHEEVDGGCKPALAEDVARKPGDMTTASQDVDAEVLARSIRTPEDFALIFDRYYVEIHGYVARRLGQDLADDIASETFLVAFAQRGQYDQAHPDVRPWLYGIASNLIARHYRVEQRRYRALSRAASSDVTEDHDERSVARLDAQALRRSLAEALSTISNKDRDVLLLVAWAGLTSEQAGEALGIPAGTARSRLHRARQRIRRALGAPAAVEF